MQGKGDACCKAVLLLLPAHFLSVQPSLQEVFVVTRARRVPATTCCDHRIQISLHPMLHAARVALQQRLLDTWRRWWLWELVELTQRAVGASGDGWFISCSSAPCIDCPLPFHGNSPFQVALPWEQPCTPVFKDALVSICTEKLLLKEWLIIAGGKRKGKYLCVINTR